jgi:four helix bundle protein
VIELDRRHLWAHVARQLIRAVGSIAANIAEDYSRSSGADRARLLEYALGSARESVVWYVAALDGLSAQLVEQRIAILVELRRLLIKTIQVERARRKIATGNPSPRHEP